MRIRSVLPHTCFLLAFLLFGVGCAGLADAMDLPSWATPVLTYALAVPAALLLALRVGPIGYPGMLATSALSAGVLIGLTMAVWTGVYSAVASTFPWSARVAIDVVLCLVAPTVWLFVIRQVSPTSSFKGMRNLTLFR